MKEEIDNIEDLEKLAKIAGDGNPLAALILFASMIDEAEKKKKASLNEKKSDNASIEKEKALTEELLKKDEKIKRLYKTISERDEQIAKLEKEVDRLKIMTAPPVISKEDIRKQKEDERYKELEEQIASLRRQIEKDNDPLAYWKYAPCDSYPTFFNKGGTTISDSAVK